MYDARHLHLAIAETSTRTRKQWQQHEAGENNDDENAPHRDGRDSLSRFSTTASSSGTVPSAAQLVSIKVMWATWNATQASVVEYGRSSEQHSTQMVTGRSYSFPMEANKPHAGHAAPSPILQWEHVVLLDDLEPGVQYQYRPGQENSGRDFSNSSWRTFNAPHPAGSKQAAANATAFFVLADMGADESDGGQTTAAIAAELTTNTSELLGGTGVKYQSLIHAGDLAYNLDSDQGRVGDRFMQQIEPISAHLPYMVAPGNHEVRLLPSVGTMTKRCGQTRDIVARSLPFHSLS